MAASAAARRIVNEANGPFPWTCWYCKDPIEVLDKYTVHHLNEDHYDDDPTNLVAVHHGCHTKVHKPWGVFTDDGRRRLSEAAKKTMPWLAPNPGHTQPHTAESRAKISAAKMGCHKGWSWSIDPDTGKRVWVEP